MKIGTAGMAFFAAAAICLSGCVNHRAAGGPPGSVSGTAQSDPKLEQPQKGEFLPTQTLTPGVGSALFPDPAWR